MKWFGIIALLLVASAIADDSESEELPLAEVCDRQKCLLPKCRCSGTDIPGGLNARDVPQFVTVTFDDGVNINNILTYRDILYNRNNTNGCSAGATFYVSHEYTNYQLLNELYNNGFEISLHSITHQTPQSYWAEASYDTLVKEIAEQKVLTSHFANIPREALKGVRLPFLQLSGNTSFQMMADHDFLYDCSWPTTAFNSPPLWPYTLDYASIQDCIVPPCPSASIPGPWVVPMVAWQDLQGLGCAMVDACFWTPDRSDADEWFKFILKNFERHYLDNRAPFPFYVHEGFLSGFPAIKEAFVRFLNLINTLDDVFMVNTSEVVEWVKNPVPIPEYRKKTCTPRISTTCNPTFCPLQAQHNEMFYYLTACNVCPRVYPWLGNPLGQ